MTFQRIASSANDPLRVVLVGAGAMGQAWLAVIAANPEVEIVAIVDLDVEAARAAALASGRPQLVVGADVVVAAQQSGAQAVIDVTVPAAHHPVTTAALVAGLPVLGEKPVAETLAQAVSLAATSRATGQLFMVSQSRRWNPQLFALRAHVQQLGAIGTVTTEFFRAPHFGGFREQMAHPLLVDMAIHPFDSARFLLGAEPVSVYCEAYNPPWSWFAGAAAANAIFEMSTGTRYVYNASWVAPGEETSWNGTWRVSAENGMAFWDGDNAPVGPAGGDSWTATSNEREGIAWALQVFVDALRTGEPPMGEVHENLMSLAMVEAAVLSADTGRRVLLDDVLSAAYDGARAAEPTPDVP